MLLPPSLFGPISKHFAHHTVWHAARLPGQEKLRETLHGECSSLLAGLNEVGSGCDFLRFHRRMVRHFFFVIDTERPPEFKWLPWDGPRLPEWVERAVLADRPDFDLAAAYTSIGSHIRAGDVEALGGFLEANDLWRHLPGASLHTRVHVAIDVRECSMYCGDETSRMRDLGQSPGNVFFWLLHDWIDRRYAECQQVAGEVVDRSPSEMHDRLHTAPRGVRLPLLI